MSELSEEPCVIHEVPTMAPLPTAIGTMPEPARPNNPSIARAVGETDPVDDAIVARYNDIFDVFSKTGALFTSEKIRNSVQIYTWDPARGVAKPTDGKGSDVLYMKEVSSISKRMICGFNRSSRVGIVPSSPAVSTFLPGFQSQDAAFSHPDGIVIDKPDKFTCCNPNPPIMYMRHNTMGRFATVHSPYKCCGYQYDIHAAHPEDGGTGAVATAVLPEAGTKWYTVHGSLLKPGGLCFGASDSVRLQIYEASDIGFARPIGEVAHVHPGVHTVTEDVTAAFPSGGSPTKRASLVSAVVLMKYLLYDFAGHPASHNAHHKSASGLHDIHHGLGGTSSGHHGTTTGGIGVHGHFGTQFGHHNGHHVLHHDPDRYNMHHAHHQMHHAIAQAHV